MQANRYPGHVPVELAFPPPPVLDARPALDGLSARWLAELATQGRSAATLRAYRGDLLAFHRWARTAGLQHWLQVTQDALWAFLAAEHLREIGLRLLARRAGTLRNLLQFGRRLGHELVDPPLRTRQPSKLAITASREDIERLLRRLRSDDFFGARDRAVVEMLYGTGVTSRECCDLDVDHVDMQAGLLRVESAHRQRRHVPLSVHVLEALRAWLALRRSAQAKASQLALFTSAGGHRLSQDTLAEIVARRSIAAGIVPPLSPRVLRNSFGVHLFEGGAAEHQVAALMGISLLRAEDLQRSTDPHKRRSSAALRELTAGRVPPVSQ